MPVMETYVFKRLKGLNGVQGQNNRIKPKILIRHKKIIEQILKLKENEKFPSKIPGVQLYLFADKFN